MTVFCCLYVSLCQFQTDITLRKVLCLKSLLRHAYVHGKTKSVLFCVYICNLKKKKYQVSDRFLDFNFNVNNVNNAIYIYGCGTGLTRCWHC